MNSVKISISSVAKGIVSAYKFLEGKKRRIGIWAGILAPIIQPVLPPVGVGLYVTSALLATGDAVENIPKAIDTYKKRKSKS